MSSATCVRWPFCRLIVPRSSDRLNDRYGHLGLLYALGAIGLFFSAWLSVPVMQLAALCLVAFALFSCTAIFWTLPGRFFSGASAAAGIALINSIGNLGGYLGPFAQEPATSWAAPHLTGIAARILSLRPDLKPFELKTVLYWMFRNLGDKVR